jgi:VanZ family protein
MQPLRNSLLRLASHPATAFTWLLMITLLLLLPGSSFPKEDWLSRIGFDKWVHIGLFTILVLCWALVLQHRRHRTVILYWTVAGAVLYGILMEFAQEYFVANRSFEMGDIAADAAGSLIGYFLTKRAQKNKPL